jgi:hypothetical protein
MTKTKSRKNNTNTKQSKKAKTVLANASNENGIGQEIGKADDKKEDILVHEQKEQLKCDENENNELLENNEQENEKECLRDKLTNDFPKKDKLVCTRFGRVLVLIFVTILTFATRYYNLQEPKHVW